jgi:hypothetical protein
MSTDRYFMIRKFKGLYRLLEAILGMAVSVGMMEPELNMQATCISPLSTLNVLWLHHSDRYSHPEYGS